MALKPLSCKRMLVRKRTPNFREAVAIETTEICQPKKGEICIRNKYWGINASDVHVTKGRFFVSEKLPFSPGYEGVGEIVEVGEDVKDFKVGQNVGYLSSRCNAYAEYVCVSSDECFIIPEANPSYLSLLVSGLAAAVSLEESAHIAAGETVLITSAAGGTGHIAVQWAKAIGCHVIGTCSSEEKEAILKELGCDRVINYKKESLSEVLSREYPKGIDVAWETIGGNIFEACVANLALRGRLVVLGGILGYKREGKESYVEVNASFLPEHLQFKSASVQGFMMFAWKEHFPSYFKRLAERLETGELKIISDLGNSTGTEFIGLEGVVRGVEYLHTGKSIGKVTVRVY